ncbi:MAG: hypothetical protein IKB02_05955 [Clostridia bacterium]|nr:hypothetical protein [Clostridia bacterium]MBR2388296.1 hypothetical protein [Clostridia bacterium]
MTRKEAEAFLEAIVKMRESATDAQASVAVNIYPTLKSKGALVKSGTRINHNGTIKRAAVDLYDTAENSPDNSPTLWEDIEYKEGYRIIPDDITTGTAFAKDECGWWDGQLYKSLIEANVWTPSIYPSGWELVE